MSRHPCSPRPPSCSCRRRHSALTAAGTRRPSESSKEESPLLAGTMKCGFNCKHVHSGLKLAKSDDSGKLVSYSLSSLEGSCKECIKDCKRLSDNESPIVKSTRTVESETENKLLYNKENEHVQQILNSSNEVELDASGPYEDSGYSSFSQQSDLSEHDECSLHLDENFIDMPQSCLLHTQSPGPYSNKNLLPALHFAKVVCSTLKKNAKRNSKIDREKMKELISCGNNRLQNIIGRKMGLDYVDILSELLHRGLRHLLKYILAQLNDMDLINVSKVSTTWKKILEDDKEALQLYNKAVQRIAEKNKFSSHAFTREYVMLRAALASIQKSAAQIPQKDAGTKFSNSSGQKGSTYSRHNDFSEVAKTLKKNESLKACVRCNSPAKYDCYLQRATCKREGCGFDYCTRCLCDYHTSKDCSNSKPLKANYKIGPLPGTKISKKNLKRL